MKLLLIPFSWLYALGLYLRYILFGLGILKRREARVKTIVLGNLLAGGAGKTPHAMLIGYILKANGLEIGFLSRGYGRKSKGFRWVDSHSSVESVGDEALLIKKRFPNEKVAVCEDRLSGIEQILQESSVLDVIILDDAYQHLKLNGGLNILLDRADKSAYSELLLPAGMRRDLISATKRADLIIKTRSDLEQGVNEKITSFGIPVIESRYIYDELEFVVGRGSALNNAVLLTALAHPKDLKNHLSSKFNLRKHFSFTDHHPFSEKELLKIIDFVKTETPATFIITSAKDWVRLKKFRHLFEKADIVLAVQNIEVDFINKEHGNELERLILEYAGKN